jgi:hypothetical protein
LEVINHRAKNAAEVAEKVQLIIIGKRKLLNEPSAVVLKRKESQMDEYGSFSMEFKLADSLAGESSPAEFRFLFDAVDEMTRSLIFNQVGSFVESAKLGEKARQEVYSSAFRLKATLIAPVDVVSIGRKSPWTVVVNIPVAGVLWVLHKMLGPEILAAWGESKLKEQFKDFVRDSLFKGAKNQVEVAAATKPQFGNLRVTEVGEGNRLGESVSVTLRRTEILQVETSDRELMNEFIKKTRQ